METICDVDLDSHSVENNNSMTVPLNTSKIEIVIFRPKHKR